MSYTAACWRPRISSFCVLQFRLDDSSEVWGWECAGWVNLARWGVRSYWGNAARGGWAWVQSSECWIQVPRKCSLEMTFPPSHLFPFTGSLWLKTKWRTNQEDTKEQGLENAASFGWNENTKLRGRRSVGSLWAGSPGGRGSLFRGSCRGLWNWQLDLQKQLSSLVNPGSCPSPQLARTLRDTCSCRRSWPGSWQANKSSFFQFLSQVRWVIWHSAHNS